MIALPGALFLTEFGERLEWRRAVLMQTATEVAEVVSLMHAADCKPVYKALFSTSRMEPVS